MAFSLLHPLCDLPIACVDVETTGASANLGHRVIEVGIVRIEGGKVVAQYEQLIDPQRRVGPGISVLTGITQEMLAGRPIFADCADQMGALLKDAAILGHNIAFDLAFLHKEFRRAKQDLFALLGTPPVLDTVRLARQRFGRGGNGLARLAARLGIDPGVSHRALPDAVTTVNVYNAMMAAAPGPQGSLCDLLMAQGGAMRLEDCASAELLPLELDEALEQRRPVMMEYVDTRKNRTQRVVQPLHVKRKNGELMLVAQCELRQERRTFRIDRIVRLVKIEETQLPFQL